MHKIKESLNNFCETTTIHGLAYLSKNLGQCTRFIWLKAKPERGILIDRNTTKEPCIDKKLAKLMLFSIICILCNLLQTFTKNKFYSRN